MKWSRLWLHSAVTWGIFHISIRVAHFSQMGKINDFRDVGINGLNEWIFLIHTLGDSGIYYNYNYNYISSFLGSYVQIPRQAALLDSQWTMCPLASDHSHPCLQNATPLFTGKALSQLPGPIIFFKVIPVMLGRGPWSHIKWYKYLWSYKAHGRGRLANYTVWTELEKKLEACIRSLATKCPICYKKIISTLYISPKPHRSVEEVYRPWALVEREWGSLAAGPLACWGRQCPVLKHHFGWLVTYLRTGFREALEKGTDKGFWK